MFRSVASKSELTERLTALRGDPARLPDASIVIPVNAKGDLGTVLQVLTDIAAYRGRHTFEVVLVVNNYPAETPPAEGLAELEGMGITVVAIPSVKQPGQAASYSARWPGLRAAASEYSLHFDADCRIPDPTALLDWYVAQFRAGAQVAYSQVGYFDYRPTLVVRARLASHYFSRWVKRAVLGIPTPRGSNFGLKRTEALRYYEQGYLADEPNIGPTFKAHGGTTVFSARRELYVLTSGRFLQTGWRDLAKYLIYRLRYNIRVLPVRRDAARYTHK
jgi:hypothetical protein